MLFKHKYPQRLDYIFYALLDHVEYTPPSLTSSPNLSSLTSSITTPPLLLPPSSSSSQSLIIPSPLPSPSPSSSHSSLTRSYTLPSHVNSLTLSSHTQTTSQHLTPSSFTTFHPFSSSPSSSSALIGRLDVAAKSTVVIPFMVKGQPFTHLSDHFGIEAVLVYEESPHRDRMRLVG